MKKETLGEFAEKINKRREKRKYKTYTDPKLENESLSEKIKTDSYNQDWLAPKDVKEKIQNVQRRLKEMLFDKKRRWSGTELVDDIDKIFIEEIGKDLLKR